MNKKNKLMKALVGLELSNKAKQEFCDIVLDKSDNESSGGGAGSADSNGEMRYYQIDMKEDTDVFVQFYGTNIKADMGEGEVQIVGAGLIFAYNIPKTNWKAVAINVDMPTYSPTGSGIISFREQLESQNGSIDDLADVGLINITKEQFYNLEA